MGGVLLALVVVLGFAPSATAGVPNDGRWAKPVVDVYSTVLESQWQVARAIEGWNASEATVTLRMVTTPCEGCITVTKMRSPADMPDTATAIANLTAPAGVSEHCTIYVRPGDRSKRGIPGVMAHELGHCLGLRHVRSWGSIMGRGVWTLMEPRPVDLERLARLYPPTTTRSKR
jgi:predicted Zn-dependent protease